MIEIALLIAVIVVLLVVVFLAIRTARVESQLVSIVSHSDSDATESILKETTKSCDTMGTRLEAVKDSLALLQQSVGNSTEYQVRQFSHLGEMTKSTVDGVSSLTTVLTDKKSRGAFGEAALSYVLERSFGAGSKLYALQYTFDTGARADAVVFAPEPVGTIAVDSKFPLENYRKFCDSKNEAECEQALKLLKGDVKRHIDAIADKYIINEVTAPSAMMFVPAEGLFADMHDKMADVIDYAYARSVWVVSPTTLMAVLSMMAVVCAGIERDKHIEGIKREIDKLGTEFARYNDRWSKLERDADAFVKDVKNVSVTSKKIGKAFDRIFEFDDGVDE